MSKYLKNLSVDNMGGGRHGYPLMHLILPNLATSAPKPSQIWQSDNRALPRLPNLTTILTRQLITVKKKICTGGGSVPPDAEFDPTTLFSTHLQTRGDVKLNGNRFYFLEFPNKNNVASWSAQISSSIAWTKYTFTLERTACKNINW